MLTPIEGLPTGVWGVDARKTVTREDYEEVIRPHLEQARREGRRVRFLYVFGPEFTEFSPGAAWEDARIGWRYLRLFERCAVVSDAAWLRAAARAVGMFLPCPVRTFDTAARHEAVEWLASPPHPSVACRILVDQRVLLVEPHGPLSVEDFDAVSTVADPWIEASGGSLHGLVVHTRDFPGWADVGSFLTHIRFVRDHHRRVRRVALATDSRIADLGPAIAGHFVAAELRSFPFDELDQAVAWAAAG